MRTLRNVAIGLVLLIAIVIVVAIQVTRTDWFRNYVRVQIIAAIDKGLGGRTELRSFTFDWRSLRAEIRGLVIHGTEPASEAPFVTVDRAEVYLRVPGPVLGLADIRSVHVDTPRVNVMTLPDGSTNIPRPAKSTDGGSPPLQTLVDLAIGYFELNDGAVRVNGSAFPVNLRSNDVRAQLSYNTPKASYTGRLSLRPLYVARGQQTPLPFTITLPIVLERDRIELQNATLSTPLSQLAISGAVRNLEKPEIAAKIDGYVALADLNQLAGASLPPQHKLVLGADVRTSGDSILVDRLNAALGASQLQASGTARGDGTLDFQASLDLRELSRLAKLQEPLEGPLNIAGSSRYRGETLELQNVRLRGLGGELTADAVIEAFQRYKANGKLSAISLQTIAARLGKPIPYSGTLSGAFRADGRFDAGAPNASAVLTIAPANRGVPLAGRIDAAYEGKEIRLRDSRLTLPHSKLEASGTLASGLRVNLTTRDLRDLFAALPSAPPVRLNNGTLQVNAVVRGTIQDPRITGDAAATRIAIQDRQFDSIATGFALASSRAAVDHGAIQRGPMRATFQGSAGLVNWSPKPNQPISLTADVTQGDLADVLALAAQPTAGYSGALTLTARATGTIGNPTGNANLTVTKGTLAGEPFDQLQAQVVAGGERIRVPSATLTRGDSQINLDADYFRDHVRAHAVTKQWDLAGMRGFQGRVQLNTTVEAGVKPAVRVTAVNADVNARDLRRNGERLGDLTARADTAGDAVTYRVTSNFASSNINATGATRLQPDYPTTLSASWRNLPIERVLALADQRGIPAKGTASGSLEFAGTVREPSGKADVTLANAVIYEEPIDQVRLRVNARPDAVEVTQLEAASGPMRVNLSGSFDHPRDSYQSGNMRFQLKTTQIALERIRNVQSREPGLAGVIDIAAEGRGTVRPAGDRVLFESLRASASARNVRLRDKDLGAAELSASGNSDKLQFTLTSGLAGAKVRGEGFAALRQPYPVNAQLTFDDVNYGPVSAAGRATVNGPAANLDQLTAALRVSRLQVRFAESRAGGRPLVLQNQGDIAASLNKGQVRVDSAHITGDRTDIKVTGSGALRNGPLAFRVDASTNLALLEGLSNDIYSSGAIVLNAAVEGTMAKPLVNGKLELQKASVTSGSMPVGLSNANGVIAFTGNTATIQSLTGEAGGGKIQLSGFVRRDDQVRFSIRANANNVRIRDQRGVSVTTNANITLAGSTESSLASGTAVIQRLSYLPQADIGSILQQAGPPVQTPASPSPILQNMRLDIAVRTAAGAAVQASLAQNLQLSADLHVRGRAALPTILGTVELSQGKLVFFGSTYRLSSGTVSFYNPNRIEPILDMTLETNAKGVTVVLTVTGPVDDMKLSYTSDPPLQFQEIVALLAAGKAPVSDPTLLANQPSQPPQSFQQRGESALLSKAVADPLSNRLQRVFGVSQLKIDPSFTSGSQVPQARVTLQQQVASNLLFTYVTALDNPNTQIVRIEWAMTPQWSATANRDENGIVSINLLYKKQFR